MGPELNELLVGQEKLTTTNVAALLMATNRVLCKEIGLKVSQMVGFGGGSQDQGVCKHNYTQRTQICCTCTNIYHTFLLNL